MAARIILDRKLATDPWRLLERGADGGAPAVRPTGDVIVPLAVWQAGRAALLAREGRTGVWLEPHEDPAALVGEFDALGVIAVRFPRLGDGRGYSTARLLRERYRWRGELRAFGDLTRDQVAFLGACGFNAIVLREGEDVEAALAAFSEFSEAYQASVEQPLPLFRRRVTGP